jgi:hypothetical protein
MNRNFYESLRGFDKFPDLTDPALYVPVPSDWYVVMTDIQGSTQAIGEGRYKDVNLAGAAAIIAVLNIAEGEVLPYVFGGDGATLLIPPALLEKTRRALSAVCAKVQGTCGLTLRAGCISLYDLYDRGASLNVAKFNLSAHMSAAMFQGSALALAETWMKKGGGPLIRCDANGKAEEPNLAGLECRWQPIASRNGHILSLLVQAPKSCGSAKARDFYEGVLRDISEIYPDDAAASPVRPAGMRLSLSPLALRRDAELQTLNSVGARVGQVLKVLGMNAIGKLSMVTGRTIGGFDGRQYLSELTVNSDTRKFDEMLRMVIDSTEGQRLALERALRTRHERGEIAYGIHAAPRALMTCLVFNRQGNHIHFVDGADGGYALAARQMKGRLERM